LSLAVFDSELSDKTVTRVNFPGYSEATRVGFLPDTYLVDASGEASYLAGKEDSVHMLQYQKGQGVITVLSDMSIWHNRRIDKVDHGMFLYQLTKNYDQIKFIYNPQVPSLGSMLWQHGYYFVISLLTIIAFVVWFHQLKTGPVFPQFSNHSRKLMQHLIAAAQFKWHRGSPQVLLEQLRDELKGRVRQSYRQFDRLSRYKQVQKLSDMTGIPFDKVKMALMQEYTEPSVFIQQVATLQQLRKQITGKRYE
jgi:hypothetical protein